MSEMQELIIETVEKIMEKYSTKEVINDAEMGIWANDLWHQIVENGMLTIAIPEELGGNGGDFSDAFSILRLAGKYSAPIPLAETYIANWLLADLGEPISDEILTIASPDESEPFIFTKEGQGWRVNGKGLNVPWARYSNKMLVIGDSSEGPILSVLPLERAIISHGQNMAGEARDEVVFEDVLLENLKIINISPDEIIEKIENIGAITRSVMMAGALENVLNIVAQHTSERTQFGRPLHRFQAVQHQIAQLASESAAASMAADCAVQSFGNSTDQKEIALAKIRINEAAGKGAPIAHQVLAAIGFTYEHTLHHSTRRLWSWREDYGNETVWEAKLTNELLKLEKDELWPFITGVK
ncbi:acyl-CoA dehydrogenase domain-containing protein [Neobacillus bataviensis LMG 21833]|uniref:Acyl-CoA dehydrogenase domain-containing protein n=1 Tax=Neobacillus bataviensis LMG 21833 TaxID=1117379 RepID=K6DFZ7_9BACI|nr:acyl-CoA dehydrogenase family protein [Neobacillus bataviensis]EKN66978.1 acyl-CoA dehydrogenase domain-containing protein [Neobacillus bataviensis LMG 21833]